MKRTLTFTPDALGRRRFQYTYDGVILGGNQQRPQPREELKAEAELQEELERISTPTPEAQIDQRFRPACARDLAPEGGTLVLRDTEVTRLLKLLEAVPWGGAQKIAIADLYRCLETLPSAADTVTAPAPAPEASV